MASSQKFAERAPVLWIDRDAFDKIMEYINLCPVEINGFGYLTRHNSRSLVLASPDDVFITDQVVTLGSADVDASTVGIAMDRAAAEERSQDLRLQWHSHVNGPAYFSGTDTRTIDSYGEAGSQWMVSMVLNKRGEFSARLDMYAPLRSAVELQVMTLPYKSAFHDQCRNDMESKVKKKIMRPTKPGFKGRGGFSDRAKGVVANRFGVGQTTDDIDDEFESLTREDSDEPEYDLVGIFEDTRKVKVVS